MYRSARPSYQSVALAHIRSAIRGSAPLNIVEYVKYLYPSFAGLTSLTVFVGTSRIGSGTGIFTRALLAHPDWSHALNQLKAFEPSEGMRQVFSETVHDNRVTVSEGTFDATNVEDGWADLVVVAQVSSMVAGGNQLPAHDKVSS